MGEMKIEYSDKKVTPFGGMKLLKDFMDKTDVIADLGKVDLPYPQSNAGLVRADSGFYSNGFLKWFEARKLNYIIAVKFYENIKYQIGAVQQWSEITNGLDVCNLYFKPKL